MAPAPADPELGSILRDLVGRWCDRRALDPLRYLLDAYPFYMGTSDEWHKLGSALRNVRGLGPETLPNSERELVENALRMVDRAIRAAGQV